MSDFSLRGSLMVEMQSDGELLGDYVATKSEAAFGEIVRRYADLVYSAALRQVNDPEQARDVAQTVFADLARKAGSLRANTLLIGWLYRGARLAALEQLRNDRRRIERERQAMELLNSSTEIPNDWNAVRPVLDEAIASLGSEDRDALLLRFFKNESLASVGATLGISEDAAQKRVSRALGKLHDFLAQRGIHTTAAALSVALAANAVQAAPTEFAASLAAGALAKAAAAGSSSASLAKLFTITNMKTAILALALAGGIGGLGLLQLNTQRQLRQAQALAQQQADEIAALRAANEQLAGQANELDQLRRQARDIPRLRGEVAQLRGEQADRSKITSQETAQSETNSPPSTEEPPILIQAKFISVPTESLKSFGWSQEMPQISLMADAQVRMAIQDLENVDGVEMLGQPRVQTGSGREAHMFMGQAVPWNGTNVDVGISLNLNAHYSASAPAISLDFAAELNQLIDVDDLPADLPQGFPTTTLQAITFTNSLSVVDGQTILMRQDLSGKERAAGSTNLIPGPKSLLVFVTPQIIRDGSRQRLERLVIRANTNQ